MDILGNFILGFVVGAFFMFVVGLALLWSMSKSSEQHNSQDYIYMDVAGQDGASQDST